MTERVIKIIQDLRLGTFKPLEKSNFPKTEVTPISDYEELGLIGTTHNQI